jgi:hypothetical protein
MPAQSIRTGPALVGEPPPDKKEAAPVREAAGSGEQEMSNTEVTSAQASPLENLREAWLRCDRTDRQLFLGDIRAGCPNLWREIERGMNGGSR